MAKHRRRVSVNEHAVLMGAGEDPRSRADHECSGLVTAFCPACEPVIYAAMASRHSVPLSSETILSWT